MTNFSERLDKILAQKNLVREDQAPHTGIWYYLWLKPKWKLWTYPYVDGKEYSHYEVWQTLAEDVAKHYNLDSDQLSELQELPYAFPRGRVDTSDILATNQLGIPSQSGKYYILHGDDFPMSKDGEIKKIISIFNLIGPATRGQVEEKAVEHEMTDPKHVEAIKRIIGNRYDSGM